MDAANSHHGVHEGYRNAQVVGLLVEAGSQVDGVNVVDAVLLGQVLELAEEGLELVAVLRIAVVILLVHHNDALDLHGDLEQGCHMAKFGWARSPKN